MTVAEARAEMLGLVFTAWAAIAPMGAPLYFDNVKGGTPPDGTFGRTSTRFLTGFRASLGSRARFRRQGTLSVQFWVPEGEGTGNSDSIGQALLSALEGHAGTVSFRDARLRDVGSDGGRFLTIVQADFTFDQNT